jgi:hypothetical protein
MAFVRLGTLMQNKRKGYATVWKRAQEITRAAIDAGFQDT